MTVVLLVGAGVFSLLLPPAPVVHAATVSVTTCNDSGMGSLRDAITTARVGDTITFATDCPTSSPITLTNGTLLLTRDLTIDGTGRQVVVDGGCPTDANSDCTGGGSTVFRISPDSNVTLRALIIQHGNANNGILGGGIYNVDATLTLTNSTLAHNSSGFFGGGIFTNPGTLTTLTVTNSTFANNSASAQGGGIFNDGTVTVTNTILAGNANGDVLNNGGTITDGGHNVVGDGSLAGGPGDTTGSALLAPLGSYGGSTQTFALLPGSAALGGDATVCATAPVRGADQRDIVRPGIAGTTWCRC